MWIAAVYISLSAGCVGSTMKPCKVDKAIVCLRWWHKEMRHALG